MGYQACSKDDSTELLRTRISLRRKHGPLYGVRVLPRIPEVVATMQKSDDEDYIALHALNKPDSFVKNIIEAYESKIRKEKVRPQAGCHTKASTTDERAQSTSSEEECSFSETGRTSRRAERTQDNLNSRLLDYPFEMNEDEENTDSVGYSDTDDVERKLTVSFDESDLSSHTENHDVPVCNLSSPKNEDRGNSKLQRFFSRSFKQSSKKLSSHSPTRGDKSRCAEYKRSTFFDSPKKKNFLSRCRRKMTGAKSACTAVDDRWYKNYSFTMNPDPSSECSNNGYRNLRIEMFDSAEQPADEFSILHRASFEEGHNANELVNTCDAESEVDSTPSPSSRSDLTQTLNKKSPGKKSLRNVLFSARQYFSRKASSAYKAEELQQEVEQKQCAKLCNSDSGFDEQLFPAISSLPTSLDIKRSNDRDKATPTFTTFRPFETPPSRVQADGLQRRLVLYEYSRNEVIERWNVPCCSTNTPFLEASFYESVTKYRETGEATVLDEGEEEDVPRVKNLSLRSFRGSRLSEKIGFRSYLTTIDEITQHGV